MYDMEFEYWSALKVPTATGKIGCGWVEPTGGRVAFASRPESTRYYEPGVDCLLPRQNRRTDTLYGVNDAEKTETLKGIVFLRL